MTVSSAAADLRYPIGKPNRSPLPEDRPQHIRAIAELPERFAAAYAGLEEEKLDTPYREGGWTLRQLAHHVADSHMQAFFRLKHAVTGDWPTIQPYDEKLWAETAEVKGPVATPLALLPPLHLLWVALLESLQPGQWERGVTHPENGRMTIDQLVAIYAWHGRHHTAHVTRLRERMGW